MSDKHRQPHDALAASMVDPFGRRHLGDRPEVALLDKPGRTTFSSVGSCPGRLGPRANVSVVRANVDAIDQ